MSGIDELISRSFSEVIKKNLDPLIEKKVKMKLFQNYGLSINQAIKNFSKMDEILKYFLKSETLSFEQNCMVEIVTFKNLNNSFLVSIKDEYLINLILRILGDKEYRQIIESTLSQPRLNSEIIDIHQLPKTSGYRKINFLIRNGFLIEVDREFTVKRRSVKKFTPIFTKIIYETKKNQRLIQLTIPLKIIKQSSSIPIIFGF